MWSFFLIILETNNFRPQSPWFCSVVAQKSVGMFRVTLVHPQAVLNVGGPQSLPPAEDLSTVLLGGDCGNISAACGSCHWVALCPYRMSCQLWKTNWSRRKLRWKGCTKNWFPSWKEKGLKFWTEVRKRETVAVSSSVTSSEVMFPCTGNKW